MLSLLCHVGRRSASAIRPVAVATFSSDTPTPEGNLFLVKEMLEEQAQEQEETTAQHRPFSGGSQQRTEKEIAKWKPFTPNTIIRPRDFTYKARFNAPSAVKSRRAQVGLPTTEARIDDVFYQYEIDPTSQSMAPEILSHFVSEMGKVYGRNFTGLTSKSQRKVGKAIRRAKMMGIIPVLSRSRGLISQVRPKNNNTK